MHIQNNSVDKYGKNTHCSQKGKVISDRKCLKVISKRQSSVVPGVGAVFQIQLNLQLFHGQTFNHVLSRANLF